MSDLQIALIVLGIIIIVAVIIYNGRQEKKLRTKISNDFIVPKKDVLVDDAYVDTEALQAQTFNDTAKAEVAEELKPTVGNEAVSIVESPESIETAEVNEKVAEIAAEVTTKETVQGEVSMVEKPAAESDVASPLDMTDTASLPKEVHAEVDLIALITATKPMSAQALLSMKQEILKDLGALTMLHGADLGNNWHRIDDTSDQNQSFKKVVCSLQLADRRGPVSKAVINKFQFAMEAIGVEFEAYVDWQEAGDAAQRAIDLDAFCMKVDQLVSLHLIQGKTPIHGTKFKGLAEANDMQLNNGKFYCFDDKGKGPVLFTLINADEQPFTAESLRLNIVRGATFQIEVPKLVNCEQTFNRVVLIAQQMANSIGAQMVDDNQRPLGTTQIEKIRQQLKVIHTAMVEREITPGSNISQRLFS
jgi:FtsZ-interacting cell division protein ZipA